MYIYICKYMHTFIFLQALGSSQLPSRHVYIYIYVYILQIETRSPNGRLALQPLTVQNRSTEERTAGRRRVKISAASGTTAVAARHPAVLLIVVTFYRDVKHQSPSIPNVLSMMVGIYIYIHVIFIVLSTFVSSFLIDMGIF
jgi:hypothetical protein